MKKLIITGLALMMANVAFATDGYQVYKKYCAACHVEKIPMEKMKQIEMMVKSGKRPPLKAPPFEEVSARLKHFFPSEDQFINFVVDYITNPSPEKAKCKPMALKMLGVMPPIGKGMTEEEKIAVAKWLYNNFHKKWEEFPMGKMEKGHCKCKCRGE